MKVLKILAACAALVLGLAACAESVEVTDVRSEVASWCDEHGNRVYVRGNRNSAAPLFVLGADPTCKTEQGR